MTERQRKARGKKYRQACDKLGLTSEEIARVMGLGDSSTVRQWWRGAARPKDPLAFARLVDIPVETVLGWG